jgi:pyrimidine operon attenuation protein / uracil phosphoribosyltransferase
MVAPRIILDSERFRLTLARLCYQLIENHDDFSQSVVVGLQPRGVMLSRRIIAELNRLTGQKVTYGELDVTFFRDDFRRKALIPQNTQMDFVVEGKKVILIDDVLFTGRSIRAGLDAMQQFGRPEKVELLVLVDRRWSREIPVSPDYVGITVDAVFSEKVTLEWHQESPSAAVYLHTKNQED